MVDWDDPIPNRYSCQKGQAVVPLLEAVVPLTGTGPVLEAVVPFWGQMFTFVRKLPQSGSTAPRSGSTVHKFKKSSDFGVDLCF